MPGTTDTVKAKLTPGEFVIRKEAVDMIGVPMLNKLNNMPEEGGHSAIDRIISMATLSNMKMMYGGGMVKPNYAGGGMVQQYGHGGSVDKTMGHMQMGGKVLPSPVGAVDSRDVKSILTQFSEFPEMAVQGVYEMNEPSGRGKRYYFGQGRVPSSRVSDLEKASVMAVINALQSQEESPQDSIPLSSVLQMLKDPDVKGDKQQVSGMMKGGVVDDSLMGMRYGGMAKKKKMMGYQDGGFIGPMPAPAPNDPLQIEARQANPEMYSGSTLGVVQDQAMMLQDSIEQDTINKARKSLQLLKLMQVMKDTSMQDEAVPSFLLDSSAELLDSANPSMMMNNNQAMESSQARNLDEYLKMQAMSRGMGAVRQGMGNEPMSIVR